MNLNETWLFKELANMFGEHNIKVINKDIGRNLSLNLFPIKHKNEILGWLEINSKEPLDSFHKQLINLLVKQQLSHPFELSKDNEEDVWRQAIEDDMSKWQKDWELLTYDKESHFINVYFKFSQITINHEELYYSIKEIILASTEGKSFLFPLKNGDFVWIIEQKYDIEKDFTNWLNGLIATLTAELMLNVQCYIGDTYKMPIELNNHIKDETELFNLVKNLQLKNQSTTFIDVIPFMFIQSTSKMMMNKVIEKVLGPVKDDTDLLQSVQIFMNENLNVSEASKKLYIHRNSMQYRIDKFIEKSGTDIRQFENALLVYLAILALGTINKE
jgi:hypothetical protein